MTATIKHARTPMLDVAYEESGSADGTPACCCTAGRMIRAATTRSYRRSSPPAAA